MLLADLVANLLKEPTVDKPVDPICPMCRKNRRAMNKKGRYLLGYCKECRRIVNARYPKK